MKKDQGWRRRKLLVKNGGPEVLSCVASLPLYFGYVSNFVPNPECRMPAHKVAAAFRVGYHYEITSASTMTAGSLRKTREEEKEGTMEMVKGKEE